MKPLVQDDCGPNSVRGRTILLNTKRVVIRDGHHYLKKEQILRLFVKKSLKNKDYFATRYRPTQKNNDYFDTRYLPPKKKYRLTCYSLLSLKKSIDYFVSRYCPLQKSND
jgi:hypothetical protein